MLVILTKTYLGHSFQLTSNLPDLTHVMSGRKKAFGKGSGNDRFEWNTWTSGLQIGIAFRL